MRNPKGMDRNYANEFQDIKLNEAKESEDVTMGRGGMRCFQSFSLLPHPHCSANLFFSPSDPLFSFILLFCLSAVHFHGHIRSLCSDSDMQLFPSPSICSLRGAPYANQSGLSMLLYPER